MYGYCWFVCYCSVIYYFDVECFFVGCFVIVGWVWVDFCWSWDGCCLKFVFICCFICLCLICFFGVFIMELFFYYIRMSCICFSGSMGFEFFFWYFLWYVWIFYYGGVWYFCVRNCIYFLFDCSNDDFYCFFVCIENLLFEEIMDLWVYINYEKDDVYIRNCYICLDYNNGFYCS